MKFGYARVSTAKQEKNYSLEFQKEQLLQAGVSEENIYQDIMSGAKKDRPGLEALKSHLREGDELVTVYLSRLGRNLAQMTALLEEMQARGVIVRALKDGVDTSSAVGRMLFGVLGAVAEMEREQIQERLEMGRKKAEELGRFGGRPTVYGADMAKRLHSLLRDGYSVREVTDRLKISNATFYRLKAKYGPILSGDGGRVIGVIETDSETESVKGYENGIS